MLDRSGTLFMGGVGRTVAVGTNLHIVAVTAEGLPPEPTPLSEGVIYQYDLTFDFADGPLDLATATENALLTYPPFSKPTFCMPPRDANQLRLLHGSCRMPHGNGKDALAIVDDLITQTAQTADLRPHQLLLTGDQIYADDVAASMLIMLSDASDVLLGWKEKLTLPSPVFNGIDTGSQLSPFMRRLLLDHSGFTSEDLDCHLITVGEYICMYLFVWSDALWSTTTKDGHPEPDLPLPEDVIDVLRNNLGVEHFLVGLPGNVDAQIKSNLKQLIEFHNSLSKHVRRVLANIPSYMIFDDHEVTDDWNMTLNMCKDIYGDPLGIRIVQNGLVAYALCQHWGNAPEQFEDTGQVPPGLTLLRLLDGGNAAAYEQNSPALRALVGVHDATAVASHKAVFHYANSLTYNYSVEGLGHQVIFTDTRTWRAFPLGPHEGGELLPPDQIQQQIVNTPNTGDRALLVVVSTNAPPIVPIRYSTQHPKSSKTVRHVPDIYDSWELPFEVGKPSPLARATDRLFRAISEKLPLVSGERRGPAILISGDVHMSFASRLLFKGSSRYEDFRISRNR